MKKIILFTAIVIGAALLIGAVALATTYEESRLTTDVATQEHPRIYAPYAVWLDWRSDADGGWVAGGGEDGMNIRDAYLYSIDDGAETKLTDQNGIATKIDLTHSHVFWMDAGTAHPGLHYYSLFENKSVHAVTIDSYPSNADYGGTFLAAWTDKVVYTTAGADGVYLYNATTGENTKLTDTFVNGLDYEDDFVVYTDTNIYGGKVYKQKISTGEVTEISTDSTKAASFSDNISMRGNRVVWQVGGTKTKLLLHDLVTNSSEFLTDTEVNRINPRVGASCAVWSTWSEDLKVYLLTIYNFETQQTSTHGSEQGLDPDVASGDIIFSSNRKGNNDIYTIDPTAVVVPIVEAPPVETDIELAYNSGDLIKKEDSTAVYYYGADGQRYVFPTQDTYFTWYSSWDNIITISSEELAEISIGGNVTYRPGVKLIMSTSGNKVYAVAKGGVIRWIDSSEIAKELYGDSWGQKIDIILDSFWVNYTNGENIVSSDEYDFESAMTGSPTINVDKGL
ncbi:hypothetical protein HQ571_03720 [Candidatus Kuenenbacteria bacterium]|nr:hypothetical protein [Candidatus Kuenenbacteria bacterium]